MKDRLTQDHDYSLTLACGHFQRLPAKRGSRRVKTPPRQNDFDYCLSCLELKKIERLALLPPMEGTI